MGEIYVCCVDGPTDGDVLGTGAALQPAARFEQDCLWVASQVKKSFSVVCQLPRALLGQNADAWQHTRSFAQQSYKVLGQRRFGGQIRSR